MRSPAELEVRLRREGQRVTKPRRYIFEALHDTTKHPTAEALWRDVRRSLPRVSLRTVYQTLNDLVDMGEIQVLDLGTGAARFDPNTEPHHHLVCHRCGRTHDLDTDTDGSFADVTLPADRSYGFEIDRAEIVFRGWCPSCSTSVVASASPDRTKMR